MIKNFFNKLSIQISAIIIICGTLGVATFCLLYAGKESFFEFTQNLGVISENTEAYANNIEASVEKFEQAVEFFKKNKIVL